jgi:hypothetical protein
MTLTIVTRDASSGERGFRKQRFRMRNVIAGLLPKFIKQLRSNIATAANTSLFTSARCGEALNLAGMTGLPESPGSATQSVVTPLVQIRQNSTLNRHGEYP